MKRVFVTGASGFIGSHVTRVLLDAGCEVAILAWPEDSLWRLQDVKDDLFVLRGRLESLDDLLPGLEKWQPDACIHLAWYAEPGKYLQAMENIPALTASLALIDLLSRVGCRQVVMAGTCAEYDADMGFLREDGPTRPETVYAAAKLSLSLTGQQLAAVRGINFAWARIFYPYGPWEDERRMVPALIRSLLKGQSFPATKGEQVRDYLYVEDVARAFWTLTEQGATGIFNICSGVPITIRDLMETIQRTAGQAGLVEYGAVSYRDWEPKFLCGDNRRLRDAGWMPRYTLSEGLSKTVDWWRRSEASC